MKITYPLANALPGGALHSLDYKLSKYSHLISEINGLNIEVSNGNIELVISEVAAILAEGGEVEDYLMVIKVPLAGLTTDVPDGLPDRTKPISTGTTVRKFNDWLAPDNVWMNETHFYFISVTVAGTQLTGSEIKILYDLPSVTVLLTTDQEFIDVQIS